MRAKRLVFCFVFLCCARSTIGQDAGKLLSRFESEHQIEAQTQVLRDIVRNYGDTAGPGLLKIAVRTKDSQTRFLAIGALGDLKFQEAAPLIVSSLSDDNPGVRKASAIALGHIKDSSSIPPLIELLKDEQDPEIVRRTAGALAFQGATAALPTLKLRANDGPTETRVGVISSIGVLGSKDEVPYLVKFLDDRDGFVALAAIIGIEHLSGENFDWCGKNPCKYEEKIHKVNDWWQAHRSTWK
jgi:HEAT repeat protein